MFFGLKASFALSVCVVWLALVSPVQAQHEGLIYGEVKLLNDETYTGQIQWGAGQMLWGDILRTKKKENPLLKYLSEDQLKRLSEEETKNNYDWGFLNLWKNKYPSRQQELKCRFGDVASLQVTGEDEATIILKSGVKINVESTEGNDHIGDPITVFDVTKGKSKIAWDKIVSIRFLATPAKLPHLKATLLFGTVQTVSGPFTGFIRWDEDEFLSTNSLDGKNSDNKDKGIRYGSIRTIEPKERGSLVTMLTGEQVFLGGKSNVNFSNGGIVVMHPAWGRALISWKAFRSVTFAEPPGTLGYDSYGLPKLIRGIVRTNTGKIYKSNFVFDLDEQWNVEMLDGEADTGISYQLIFKGIKQLKVKNHEYTEATLHDGKKVLLTDGTDVTYKNWGVLVWLPKNKYQYIPWNRVATLNLE